MALVKKRWHTATYYHRQGSVVQWGDSGEGRRPIPYEEMQQWWRDEPIDISMVKLALELFCREDLGEEMLDQVNLNGIQGRKQNELTHKEKDDRITARANTIARKHVTVILARVDMHDLITSREAPLQTWRAAGLVNTMGDEKTLVKLFGQAGKEFIVNNRDHVRWNVIIFDARVHGKLISVLGPQEELIRNSSWMQTMIKELQKIDGPTKWKLRVHGHKKLNEEFIEKMWSDWSDHPLNFDQCVRGSRGAMAILILVLHTLSYVRTQDKYPTSAIRAVVKLADIEYCNT